MKEYAPKQFRREEREQPKRQSANGWEGFSDDFAPVPHPNKEIQAKYDAMRQAQAAKNPLRIQPKLTIGSPNDKFEKDADRTAEKVMSSPKAIPTEARPIEKPRGLNNPLANISRQEMLQMLFAPDQATFETLKKEAIQRQVLLESKAANTANDGTKNGMIQPSLASPSSAPAKRADDEETKKALQKKEEMYVQRNPIKRFPDLEATLRASYGKGQPMSDELRSEMETRFGGLDFSAVRIHTDGDAQRMCIALHARAFTSGPDIYFNTGEWDPVSKAGKILLAHELTHTIHQGSTKDTVQREAENDEPEVQMLAEDSEVQMMEAREVQEKEDVQTRAEQGLVQLNSENIEVQREPSDKAKILKEIVKKKNKDKRKNAPGWVNTLDDLEEYMFRATTEQENEVKIYKPNFADSPDQDRYILYRYLKTIFHADDSVIWKTINQHKRPDNFVLAYTSLHDTPVNDSVVSITIPVTNQSFLRGLEKLYAEGRPDLKQLLLELEMYSPRFTWLDQRNLAGLFQHMHRISPLEILACRLVHQMSLKALFNQFSFSILMVKMSGKFHADLEHFRANKIEYLKDSGLFEAYFSTDDPVKTTQLTSAVERINLINPAAIKLLLEETSENDWKKHYKGDHPSDGAALKKLLKRFKKEIKFERLESIKVDEEEDTELDQLYQTTGHTRNEPFDFVHLFQEQAMRLAFQMIKMNQDLLREEYAHYSDQDQEDVAIKKLFVLLDNNFVDPYHEGNETRAIGLRKFFKTKYGDFLSGVDSADVAIKTIGAALIKTLTNNSIPVIGPSFLSSTYPILRSLMGMKQERMVMELRKHSRHAIMAEVKSAIMVKEQLDHAYSLTLYTAGIMSPESIIMLRFPELLAAEGMDNKTDQSARDLSIEEFPIMADLSVDPRQITFAAKSAKSYEEFRKFIHNLISEKLENGDSLKTELADSPEKVWELDGLITQTKEKYGIFEGSISDQLVNDVIGDIADAQFWSDIFLGAVGIVLAVAGIFTGGLTTVLGVGLLTAGAAVSIAEFVIAKDRYDFTVMSTDTAIGVANELSYKEPNALGMILAMIGMGLDLIPFIKLLSMGAKAGGISAKMVKTQNALAHAYTALNSFADGGKAMTRADLQKQLLPLYEELGTAATKGFAKNFDEFTDTLLELFTKQKKSMDEMGSIISTRFPEVAASMSDIEKVGWSKLWSADPKFAERLFAGMLTNPALRTKIGTYALIDPNTPTSIARLEKLLGGAGWFGMTSSKMSRTLQHILSKGGDDWVQLPVLLTKLEGLGAPSTKFVETVLTQPRLTHLLKSGDDAATALYSSWNTYFYGGGNKLGQTFVDFAEGGVKKVVVGGQLQKVVTRINGLGLDNMTTRLDNFDEVAKARFADDVENLSDIALKQLDDNFELLDDWKKINALSDSAKASKKPAWLQKIIDGNKFNKIRQSAYPNNEVYLVNPKDPKRYVRLDSYKPGKEIVSRKHTQFAEIQESTGIKYLEELSEKYPPNTKIANVSSNRFGGANGSLKDYIGKGISGKMILEIPAQTKAIPDGIINRANILGIEIRDVQGKIYNL